ncbi:hypothetical protein [Parasulfitobacter algicola]|uniref:Uncharacterized protein n=1 Tax=Parasulfitobacter algicola TaxID=2614809 RepID=A0ABX2IU31_9RHOB|nr:hypothetical protein [Sulfitobacter algicola]NSX56418.1 hypothetical protein [Sulfitobacter algicola]
MACLISFQDTHIQLSNRHFDTLLEFTLEICARSDLSGAELDEYRRIKDQWDQGLFWSGRGLTIEEDMPDIHQQKVWARMFADTARAIFLRQVGYQGNTCWQTRAIYQAIRVSDLFITAVRVGEKGWYPETQDQIESRELLSRQESHS